MSGFQPATPMCKHWGHALGEWKYSCCACSGMPSGCEHCETDWDGNLLYPDGVLPTTATDDDAPAGGMGEDR